MTGKTTSNDTGQAVEARRPAPKTLLLSEALFHPAWRFGRKRHRPEVIDLILHTLDETQAVRQADAAR